MKPTKGEQCAAIIAVFLIHGMLLKLLTSQGQAIAPGDHATSHPVRFIERAPPSRPETADPAAPGAPVFHSPRTGRVAAQDRMSAPAPASGDAAATSRANEPLDLTFALSAAPDFSRRPLEGDTRLDRFAAPPERIPMRKPLTGKDVIEGTAQLLGFWPPGYTTDPCPRIRRNIDELKTDASAAGRERLDQEMARQARYCP